MPDFILDNLQYIAVGIYIFFMVIKAVVSKSNDENAQHQRRTQPPPKRSNTDEFESARRMVEEMIAKKNMQSQKKPPPTLSPQRPPKPVVSEIIEEKPIISQKEQLEELKASNAMSESAFNYDANNDLGNYQYDDISDAPTVLKSKSFKIHPQQLRQALIMSEILGKPKALREENTI